MKTLITLDVGTTAVKAGLFSQDLKPLGFVIEEYTLYTPQNDIVELDPDIYWKSASSVIKKLLSDAKATPGDVVCITCTTQGETLIPVDKNINPLRNAIVWLDNRAKKESSYLEKRFSAKEFYAKTGLPEMTPTWPVAKVLWLKNNEPDVYYKTHKILLLEDYLVAKMTGKFVTNPGIMCTSGYFDIVNNKVWTEIIDYCGIDAAKIPKVLPCGMVVGNLCEEACKSFGLPSIVKVTTGAMDQITASIGSGNIRDGIITESTGTAQVIAATCTDPGLENWKNVTVYTHGIPGKFLLVNVSQTAGIILKWFRDEFCPDLKERFGEKVFDAMGNLASTAPPLSKGLLLFPYFTGTQIPKADPNTRGVFFGMGLDTGRDCFIRAIMEGVGYMLRESIDLLKQTGIKPDAVCALGGGSKSRIWNQIKADICNILIKTMEQEEAASVGAAILGSVACGLFADIDQACALLHEKEEFIPNEQNNSLYNKGYMRYKSMYEMFNPLFNSIETE